MASKRSRGHCNAWTQAVDADLMGTLGKTVHGVPELVPQGGSVDQSGFVLVRLEPLAQRLAQDGIAGGFDKPRHDILSTSSDLSRLDFRG
jgi:hypothetical protein